MGVQDFLSAEAHDNSSEDYGPLTRRQAENIADLAERRALERLYAEIGRGLVRKAVFVAGAAGAALLAWLTDLVHIGHR